MLAAPDPPAEPDDAQVTWRAVEPVYDRVSLHDGPERLTADLAPLTAGQRALLALHWTIAEVCNGGFDQYFDNATGALAAEAAQGARRVGAARTAGVIEAAMRAYAAGASPPPARARALDERFHRLIDTELYPRAAAYVRAQPGEFAAAGAGVAPAAPPPAPPPIVLFDRGVVPSDFNLEPLYVRCTAAAEAYRRLGGRASDVMLLGPAPEARVRRVEAQLQATLPPTLRALFLACEAGHFEWSLPPEATAGLGASSPVASGRLTWDLGLLWHCEQLRRAWVKDDFRDRGLPENHQWQDALCVAHLGGGEFLAVDLRSATGEGVVLLHPRREGLHGVELAPTFAAFLDRWSRLGCPGPEPAQLAPFVTRGRGLDPDGAAAAAWRGALAAG